MDHKIVFEYITNLLRGKVSISSFNPIDVGINPIKFFSGNHSQVEKMVISCAFAGTNWITRLNRVIISSEKIEIKIIKEEKKIIPIDSRKCTFDNFLSLMSNQIIKLLGEKVDGQDFDLGISLGFAHKNFKNNLGFDAEIIPSRLTKSWQITDADKIADYSIGNALNEQLKTEGIKINTLVVLNDTNSILADNNFDHTSVVPAAFVFGTGVNAALKTKNLEIGQIQLNKKVVGNDDIHDKAFKLGYFDNRTATLEQLIGGNYLKIRVAMQLEKDRDKILNSEEPDILNQILSKKVKLESDIEFASKIVKNEYEHAGKLAGSLIAAVVNEVEEKQKYEVINVEGSVFWKNIYLKEIAIKTARELTGLTEIEFKQASGLNGIALLTAIY